MSYLLAPTTTSLSSYFDAHNAYVQQLQATNGMLDQYHQETLPQLLQVSALISSSFLVCRILETVFTAFISSRGLFRQAAKEFKQWPWQILLFLSK